MSDAMRVAVIGSGPAGLYTADELCRQHGDVLVDVIDRLPCPYGLLRYGVAPDHLKMKSLESALRRIMERPEVRFLGGIDLGSDLGAEDLPEHYDAVVYATGAGTDRRLGIPGEDLPGSFSAKDFVAWYCGHPDALVDKVTLNAHAAVVVGAGNVAIDVARILAKSAGELRETTDMPDHVLDALDASTIRDIHLVARRGPAQARFTTKELRELGELTDADVIVDPEQLELDGADRAIVESDRVVRRNMDVLAEWAGRRPRGRARRVHLHFRRSPVAVLGAERVTGVALRSNGSNGVPVAGRGSAEVLPAELLVRSVGYRGQPLPGVPFDEASGVIPHERGRVRRADSEMSGEYVVGWIKRGPTGVIGTNKSDAKETVATMLDDRESLPRACRREPDAVLDLLRSRDVPVVTWQGWEAIEAAEQALGSEGGRSRVKITDREALLALADAVSNGGSNGGH